MILLIVAFVGKYSNELFNLQTSLRGNGKTLSMTYYLLMDYIKQNKNCFSNHYISFPKRKNQIAKQANSEEIFNIIFDDELDNCSVGLDELPIYMNSLDNDRDKIKFATKFIYQSRKKRINIYYTAQRQMDVHIRIRQQTDMTIIPTKYHYNNEQCFRDNCKEDHYIVLICVYPVFKPLRILDCQEIGKYYDSNEIIKE
jgi:hypothetical protein